jgi:hypothetical protein
MQSTFVRLAQWYRRVFTAVVLIWIALGALLELLLNFGVIRGQWLSDLVRVRWVSVDLHVLPVLLVLWFFSIAIIWEDRARQAEQTRSTSDTPVDTHPPS